MQLCICICFWLRTEVDLMIVYSTSRRIPLLKILFLFRPNEWHFYTSNMPAYAVWGGCLRRGFLTSSEPINATSKGLLPWFLFQTVGHSPIQKKMETFGCEYPPRIWKSSLKKSHLVPSSPRIHHEVASAAGEENDVLWMAGICYLSCCGGLICI